MKKRQIAKAITLETKEKEEEGIESNMSKSKSDCIIIASSKSVSK